MCDRCQDTGRVTYEVRARIDFAEVLEHGAVCAVRDYKSSYAAPPYDEVARKRRDGSLAAKSFQLVLYALCLAYGVPVREEECEGCGGCGMVAWPVLEGGQAVPPSVRAEIDLETIDSEAGFCEDCNGRGRIEVREPFPVASRAQRFDLEFVYPALENQDGKMIRRPVTLTRLELEQYRASLEGVVARLAHADATGDWPAVVSDEACHQCPSSPECPIPAELRDHRGEINTPGECADALEVRARVAAEQRAIGKEIRAFVKANGPVRFGREMVAEIGFTQSERIKDKDGFMQAVDRAVRRWWTRSRRWTRRRRAVGSRRPVLSRPTSCRSSGRSSWSRSRMTRSTPRRRSGWTSRR
jgi:hypothetical protein